MGDRWNSDKRQYPSGLRDSDITPSIISGEAPAWQAIHEQTLMMCSQQSRQQHPPKALDVSDEYARPSLQKDGVCSGQ